MTEIREMLDKATDRSERLGTVEGLIWANKALRHSKSLGELQDKINERIGELLDEGDSRTTQGD